MFVPLTQPAVVVGNRPAGSAAVRRPRALNEHAEGIEREVRGIEREVKTHVVADQTRRRVELSVAESGRILRELQELTQSQLSAATGRGTDERFRGPREDFRTLCPVQLVIAVTFP